jgi:ABC-type transport system involved in multi-copper enzyme maturation permease subunit
MMANEYSNRTLKQNLIDGLSKKEFVLSKFYTVILFSLLSTVFVGITALILGLIYSDFTEFAIIITDLEYLLAYFIKLVAFFSFGLFLGVLIKRSAFAVGAMLVWAFTELIITGVLKWTYKIENYESITQFFPLNAMSNLIKEPITRFNAVKSAVQQLGEEVVKDFSVQWLDIVITLAWTIIFILGSYYLLKKRDL